MDISSQAKPAIWGAVIGAAGAAILGFTVAGWVTAATAESMASQPAAKVVVAALTPICVENFNRGKDTAAHLAELKKASSWDKTALITKGGWAMMPGATSVDSAVAASCAEKLLASKT